MAPRTISRALNIDSMFRKNTMVVPSTDMQMTLPTTLHNVVEMGVSQVEIPHTFYNVSRALGNRTFVINDGTSILKVVRLPEGRYQVTHDQDQGQATKTLADIELAVNNAMLSAGVSSDFVFTVDKVTQKGVFATKNRAGAVIKEVTLFFNVDDEGNVDEGGFVSGGLRTKLGWLLGFRSGTYWLKAPSVASNAVAVVSEAATYVPNNRYMYLVIDDYCNESYENFTSVFHDSLNTKNVLARIDLGDTVDHTHWTLTPRAYRFPVSLTRLRITLTDELGRIVDLNGVDWSAVLVLKCLVEG